MKLKTFDQENMRQIVRGKPRIRLTRAGLVSFNMKAGELIGLKGGSKVHLSQNEEMPGDWYVSVTDSDAGFSVRQKKEGDPLLFNSANLTRRIFESIGVHEKSVGFSISANPVVINGVKYYYIVSKGYKSKV